MTVEGAIYDLDTEARLALISVATDSIRKALEGSTSTPPHPDKYGPELAKPGATFVTLESTDERLLGCIGTIQPTYPLVVDAAKNALMAAFRDYRTTGVGPLEFESMSLKISVLSPIEPMIVRSFDKLTEAVRPGVDGLLLDADRHHSTLLPSVWPKVSGVEEFLEILWMKAGLRPREWSVSTRLSRYTTVEFGDHGPREAIARR